MQRRTCLSGVAIPKSLSTTLFLRTSSVSRMFIVACRAVDITSLHASGCPVVVQANLVKMVREGVQPVPVTLAIGDGANDVPMLQQAQV